MGTNQNHSEDNIAAGDGAEGARTIPISELAAPSGVEPDEAKRPAGEDELKRRLEAVLFAADEPLSSGKLAALCDAADGRKVRSLIGRLQAEYDAQQRAFQVEEIAGGFQLLSRPQYHLWVKRLQRARQEESLSQAALETLAIICYRQPVLRAKIEDVRGVQCDHILRSLLEKGLIRVVGRSEELGRPLLYGTTGKFLEAVGLRDLTELPPLDGPHTDNGAGADRES